MGESRDVLHAEQGVPPLERGHGGAGLWDLVRVRQEYGWHGCPSLRPLAEPLAPSGAA